MMSNRAHRAFSEEQIQNIAIISRLRREDRCKFVELIDSYFKQGMKKLKTNKEKLKAVSKTVTDFLKTRQKNELPDFAARLEDIRELEKRYNAYTLKADFKDIDKANKSQRELAEFFKPFFTSIHDMLKVIDKKVRRFEKEYGNAKEAKTVKVELDELHKGIGDAEYFFTHITWLQERFPEAKYEDVTGLCKLASLDKVKEKDYSLNPGRYVGVIIEEDGKTEGAFIDEILTLNNELEKLNQEASVLQNIITHNVRELAGDL